jgi:dolichol-phosphate mannosyltransferase
MDADRQHDEGLLPAMLAMIEAGGVDLVIASRFAPGGSTGALARWRRGLSRIANRLAARLCRLPLTDAMSGCFMLRRSLFKELAPELAGTGSKILLDLVTAARRPLRTAEVPLRFRPRHYGESKLDARLLWEFLCLVRQMAADRMRRRDRAGVKAMLGGK